MSEETSRRRLLGLGLTGGVAALAGCLPELDERPEPNVQQVVPSVLEEPVDEQIEVQVLVHNLGDPGDIEITVEGVNAETESVTADVTTVEFFERDEQRRVFLELNPGRQADGLRGSATAA